MSRDSKKSLGFGTLFEGGNFGVAGNVRKVQAKFLGALDFACSEGFLGICHPQQILLESSNFKIEECQGTQKMVAASGRLHKGRWPPEADHFLRTRTLLDFEIRGFQ